jgi:type I restriction enzyme R subunit
MSIGLEAAGVQAPAVRYSIEAGWTYLSFDDALRLRSGEEGILLRECFIDQVQRLNPGVVDHSKAEELAKRVARVLPRIEGNLDAWEYLRGLKTIFVPSVNRERNVRLLAEDWRENQYHVTDELRFYNGTRRIRLDVAFFINGVPILLIETKSATKMEGMAEALEQVRRYHREGPEMMSLMQVFSLTHLVDFLYGPTWSLSRKALFNWRDEAAGQDFESLVKSFIHPQRITHLIKEFILFTRKDDELSKVILRPHQMRAVERVVRRSADPEKRRGLVWHTQGSGKTYTMITAAKQIIQEPMFENPTVLMLVDRNELEAQLFGNLKEVGFGSLVVAQTKKHLRRLLREDRRGLIVSMIHKFDDMPGEINIRRNIFVLVDEAHRTTGGDLGNYLMGALPNATYIGFTGTPIDKTAYGKGTFKIFGTDDPKGYLDKYSIAQSIEDHTTVPLHYTLAPSELRVDRTTLDEEFLNLVDAEGLSDPEELDRILDKAVNLRNMLKNEERMQRIGAYLAEHFLNVVEPMGYKAVLVAVDREACARYKRILDNYLPQEYSEVVYSPGHNDPPALARHHLSEEEEKQVRKAFRDHEQSPQILIVTEKLLTGFDAPILYCMYLDKPMRDHVLLQAIARVNRPYEDDEGRRKTAGFVLDFVGIFEKLEKALAFDSKDVEGVVTDIDVLMERFGFLMAEGRSDYLPLARGPSPDKAAESVLKHFRDEDRRHAYYRYFRELEDIYEILSPDPFLRPFLEDYDQLTRIYKLLRSAFEAVFVDPELTRKTARLVQAYTHSGPIRGTLDVYEIDGRLLERLADDETADTIKVFNLLKSIQKLVNEQGAQEPYLLTIGERAEAIAEAYQMRQQATQDTLRSIEDLIREINRARRERAEKDLDASGFAVYWLLDGEDVPNAEQTGKRIEKVFQRLPHWDTDPKQERELRQELYPVLLSVLADTEVSSQIERAKNLIDQILRIVRRARERQ